jgi:hypothetical protein
MAYFLLAQSFLYFRIVLPLLFLYSIFDKLEFLLAFPQKDVNSVGKFALFAQGLEERAVNGLGRTMPHGVHNNFFYANRV